jgi:hypothetical protein
MSRTRWLAAVWIVAALVPLAVFHRTAVAPAERLVAALPSANPLDDPATNATAVGRAWARWERGDLRIADDRVFAPIPDALASGEWLPLASILGYPFHALTGSVPAGVNAAYFLAVLSFPVLLYALYARLAGPGLVPAVAAFAVAYGPGRMNTLGVLAGLSTGFALLVAMAACDFFRRGRGKDLALFGAALVVQGLFSLYGIALGLVFAVPAVLVVVGRKALQPRRVAALALTGLAAFLILAVPYAPYFHIGESLGVMPGVRTFEAHSADLLSLLHGGIFGGPVRDVLERLVPGFPLGAAAFFPTLAFTFAIGLWAVRGRASRSPIPWLCLAAFLFVCSLGPTIHVAGRPVGPGPYRVLTGLPIFSTLRGIHRFDQWFDVALGAAAVLSLAAVAGHARAAAFRAAFTVLALLDLWPADIPATTFPVPSGYVDRLAALPRDASVAVYPWNRSTSTQAWVDQLRHGRRVVNGWFTYAPATHTWAERALAALPVRGGIALLGEMGASAVAIDRRALSGPALADVDDLAAGAGGIEAREDAGGFTLLRLVRREPCFVQPGAFRLDFRGRTADAACRPDGLVFRAGPEEREVLLRSPDGTAARATLRAPVASPPPLRFTLSAEAPAGATVEDAKSGRMLGQVAAR